MEIICATLSDFFVFVDKHIFIEDLEKLAFMCMKKVVLRYLIFLRDLLLNKNLSTNQRFSVRILSRKKKNAGVTSSADAVINDTSTVRMSNLPTMTSSEMIAEEDLNADAETESVTEMDTKSGTDQSDSKSTFYRIRADVRCILQLYSNTIVKIRQQNKPNGTADDIDIDDYPTPSECGFSDMGDETEGNLQNINNYEKSTSALLSMLSNTTTHIFSGDISEADAIEKLVKSNFFFTVPQYSPNVAVYSQRLTDFFLLNSMSANVSSGISGMVHNMESPTYSILLSELSCMNLGQPRNCFLRISFQGSVQETAIQQNGSLISWKDNIRFENIQDYQNKVINIQLVEFRIRALKAFREKIIGNVVLNLCDSESPVRSTGSSKSEGSVIGGNSPYDGNNLHHVFSLCGWFEVDTNSHKLIRRMTNRSSKANSSSSKGSQATSPSSANSSQSSSAMGISLKDKSVVAASTAAPREECSNPQLNVFINISRRFAT
mmetsp:Transcript_21872/g.31401  ORF Transcript_21872/g.31401 Transcript_21872/m.31401 type:complete len:491 (+) Transcript_21872:1-1473(+)